MSVKSFASVDQMGNYVTISFPPKRIISLVPSQTELLADLGLDQEVVGITKFCIHPERWKHKPHVGGTKHFDFEIIKRLGPDLIIGNKEENFQEGIAALREICPVWMSDIETLSDATSMIRAIGVLTDREHRAIQIAGSIEDSFGAIPKFERKKTLYLIWKKPWMVAGRNTFIDHIMSSLGLINAVNTSRYPELSESEIQRIDPELILLSSEPYPFNETHRQALMQLCPNANVQLVDGEMFSWYGSRLLKAPAYFETIRQL